MRQKRKHRQAIEASLKELVGKEITLTVPIEIKAAVADGSDGPKIPTFSMVAYTGGKLVVAGWDRPVIVDLNGLAVTKDRPVLRDHDLARVVGHTTDIAIAIPKLLVAGLVSGTGNDAAEVKANAGNGFPWQASIGVTPQRIERLDANRVAVVNGIEQVGPAYIARASFLRELSVVSLGADDNTSVSIAAGAASEGAQMGFEEWAASQGFDLSTMSADAVKNLETLFSLWQADQTEDAATGESEAAAKSADAAATATGVVNAAATTTSTINASLAQSRKAEADEMKRVHSIKRIAGAHPDIAAQAIEEGWTADATELKVLRASMPKAPTVIGGGSSVAAEALPNIYAAAICLSAGLPEKFVGDQYGERVVNAAMRPENRRVDFTRIAREILAAHGERASFSRLDDATIRRLADIDAYGTMQRSINAASGSNLTPISMSGILGDSARKALVAGFLSAETVCTQIAQAQDVPDFKAFTWYRMVGVGQFQKLGTNGNFQATQLKEASYSATLDTAGTMVTLGRQEFVNDDLGAFLNVPKVMGRQAAIYQDKTFFTLLLSNPSSFFSSGNKNYFNGSTTVLGIDSLITATQMFREMVDENGDAIGLAPKILLVPSALKALADMIYMSPTIVSGSTGKNPSINIYAGAYKVVDAPYLGTALGLSGGSDTAWYLLADPGIATIGVLAYLQGNRTPTIQDGVWQSSKLAMDFTAFFDFGCGMGEKKAGVMSKGVA